MQGIDCHCHLEYMANPESVIAIARERMAAIVTSVADPSHIENILSFREKHKDFVFISAGLHPTAIERYNDKIINDHIELIRKNKDNIASIGETGLDYHHIKDPEGIEKSKKIFVRFIELANELKKPIVIHTRNAMPDTLEIMKKIDVPVMMHCFSGNNEELKECVDRGYHISFTTMIVKSKRYRKLAKKTPIEKILLETDGPWLDPRDEDIIKEEQEKLKQHAPDDERASDDDRNPFLLTNRPWNIMLSAEKMEKILHLPKEEILKITTENARKLFSI
ncbi:TatD family hydrolase [Candidatus Aenigmatarchaeota archaeon]